MSLGFQNAGYEILAAFDNWKPALEVYRKNFPNHPAFHMDLSEFNGDASFFSAFNPDMIIGGPPCQDFSSAGKRNEGTGRANLTIIFARIVRSVLPMWFVYENVDRAIKSKAYLQAKTILKEAGYALTEKVLDASLCRVPQFRKRLFLIGELHVFGKDLDYFLNKNLSSKPMSLYDYFGDSLGIEHYYRHPRSYKRRAIFSVYEPSPTIRGVNRPVPPKYTNHPGDSAPVTDELRPLTTQERSMIQTFPKDFIFEGNKSDLEQMIGNAVPVKMAEYLGKCILEYIASKSIYSSSGNSSLKKESPIQLAIPYELGGGISAK
jgi:DNA (cytosine-5)-methyltransferase 1